MGAVDTAALPPAVTPDEIRACARCSRPAVRHRLMKKMTPGERAEVQKAGIRRIASRGLCDTCCKHSRADGTITQFPLDRKNVALEFDIPTVWEWIRSEGGGYADLGAEVGLTAGAAQKLVQRLRLPEVPNLWERNARDRAEFLEELNWLLQFRRGVHEIARQFSLTDVELIQKVDDFRSRGLTTLNLNYPNPMNFTNSMNHSMKEAA